eukprot:CAMPEP_0170619248 /NCGR_PEP_ID=MMETSP0224-20130122/27415_1 /TAXON_ID=285029 /ORGANISM="Togula jolla, Strain CCCM 725" /LENGTH=55 /DNA_ID=CAMNT_0010945325 /DNA_START=106 /DNA_END=273 /DNA_ORIENTATION=-
MLFSEKLISEGKGKRQAQSQPSQCPPSRALLRTLLLRAYQLEVLKDELATRTSKG